MEVGNTVIGYTRALLCTAEPVLFYRSSRSGSGWGFGFG